MFETISPTTIDIVQANKNEVQTHDNIDIVQANKNKVQTQGNRDNIYSKHTKSLLCHLTFNNLHRIKKPSLHNM